MVRQDSMEVIKLGQSIGEGDIHLKRFEFSISASALSRPTNFKQACTSLDLNSLGYSLILAYISICIDMEVHEKALLGRVDSTSFFFGKYLENLTSCLLPTRL